jgi:hypothetical protein
MTSFSLLPVLLTLLASGTVLWGNDKKAQEQPWPLHIIDASTRGADGVKLADFNGDGRIDIVTGWEEGAVTKMYMHPGPDRVKSPWPAVRVGETASVEDAVFVDLDHDGALDIVSCCEGQTKTVFVHWAPLPIKDRLEPALWTQAPLNAAQNRMQWMFAQPMQVDRRLGIDLVAGGKGKDAHIGWFASPPGDPRDLAAFQWYAMSPAGWIMSLITSDMDTDGDLDVLVSDRRGNLKGCRWLENPGPGLTQKGPWENHPIGGGSREVMFAKLVDLDQDGRLDVVTAAKPRDVLWFRRLDSSGLSWQEHSISYPENTGTAKAVAIGDLDADGQLDMVISCESADAPKSGVMWMSYSRSVFDTQWTAYPISGPKGIKFDRIELLDLDGDRDLDVLTCEERHQGRGLGVIWYENPHQ